jgi:murein DD-endopeptidase MepM/ murein hydrolase activator NlpD
MEKYFLATVMLLIFTLGTLFLYKKMVSGNVAGTRNDRIELENAIIINGIEMDSDEPMLDLDEEENGQIIFDDTFDDTIIDYTVLKNEGEKTNSRKGDSVISKLKRKDPRWHLSRYKIRKNDNLWKIAKRFGIRHTLIISVNSINNPDMLSPGKYIQVPTKSGYYHKVRKGDTLSGLSQKYGVRRERIVSHNNISRNIIRLGERIFIPDAVKRESVSRKRRADQIGKKKKQGKSHIASKKKSRMRFSWPLLGRITSGFGKRKDPISGKRRFHCGIDISANVGTPVKAAADGKVIYSGWKAGYGNVVILRHKNGYISVYAHNSKNVVKLNRWVKRGQVIAKSGMTGAVTGAHLHFEIRKYINALNPMRMLR